MTEMTLHIIGHTMLIRADDEALTECRWIEDRSNIEASDFDPARESSGGTLTERAAREIREYLAGERKAFDVPVKTSGTPFRQKVWEELKRIPYGETVSYGELARRIGSPASCRAVANACGANPLPVIIPCHRVVAAGGPGGYTGGLDIKLALLDIEKPKSH